MKKILILTATLLIGGMALPAAAQSHRGHYSSSTTVFISGHLPCGSPIYSKRVRTGHHYQSQRLSGYELRRYLDRQRRIAAQRELERRIARDRHHRSRYTRSVNYSRCHTRRR